MNKMHKKINVSKMAQFEPQALEYEEEINPNCSIGRFMARNPSFSPREASDFGVTLVIPENKIGQKMSLRVDKTSYVPVILVKINKNENIEVRMLENYGSYKKNDVITVGADQIL
jgi:hypothetical protein